MEAIEAHPRDQSAMTATVRNIFRDPFKTIAI